MQRHGRPAPLLRAQITEELVRSDKPHIVERVGPLIIIRGVKVVGKTSPNKHQIPGAQGTRYTEQALYDALPLYEGLKVNVNHPDRKDLGKDRSTYDRLGKIEGCYIHEGEMYAEKLVMLKSHPMAERLADAAEAMPEAFALSHNAFGNGKLENGIYVIYDLEPRSVDVVADGGTNTSLFESAETDMEDDQILDRVLLEDRFNGTITTPDGRQRGYANGVFILEGKPQTAAQQAALKKAQQASAQKRKGRGKVVAGGAKAKKAAAPKSVSTPKVKRKVGSKGPKTAKAAPKKAAKKPAKKMTSAERSSAAQDKRVAKHRAAQKEKKAASEVSLKGLGNELGKADAARPKAKAGKPAAKEKSLPFLRPLKFGPPKKLMSKPKKQKVGESREVLESFTPPADAKAQAALLLR